ncbi:PAS/PAC domain [Caulobacter sp. RHG1]|nr:PAS/PAC domain [Caulobacter sp. RHG1]
MGGDGGLELDADEAERLAALKRHNILDTPSEPAFDRIVALARIVCSAPIALISFIDRDRQWLKAKVGLDVDETPIDKSVCALAIRWRALFQIQDLSTDPRTRDMALDRDGEPLRFYAGMPLVTRDGFALGTLCVVDLQARTGLTDDEAAGLALLAQQIIELIEVRVAVDDRARVASDNREKLALAVSAARMGQFDYVPATGELDWDDRCRELFGLPPGAPVSYETAFLAGLHPDDRDYAATAVGASLEEGKPFDVEYRTIGLEDGVERHVHAQGMPILENGAPVRLIGTVQDVTADRLRRAKLLETEERLRLAHRATNDAIWDWDLTRDHVFWNEALCEVYGYRPEDVVNDGAWWIEHIHPDDRARIDESIHLIIDGEASDWTDEYRFRRADGTYADIRDRGYVLRDATGKAVRMIGAMLDQSERVAIERGLVNQIALTASELEQVWTATNDLMGRVGQDGRLQSINPAWERLLGWRETDLLGRPFFDLIDPADRTAAAGVAQRLARGERVSNFVDRLLGADGDARTILWDAIPDGDLFYVIGRDLTEQRAIEERLRQSQKMEAVGQLTGGLAHDFNNMLTGVIGSLELLKRNIAEQRFDRVDRYIDAATSSAQRAAALTQRLLAFSRRQSLDVRTVDVDRVIVGMEELLRRTLGEGVGLDLKLDAKDWNARTDANQLESALLNLAINARDAMPDGGVLTIESHDRTLDVAAAGEREDLRPGEYVEITVSDTGQGMTPDVAAKAFDPFFTTKPIGHGTGLGLSMIYGFVKQSGGDARISSEPGHGAVIRLYLPRDAAEVEDLPDAPTLPLAPARDGERIMVVEDDPAVRMLVTEVLGGLGYGLIEAADGREACRLLDARPQIDLLVTDVGLPGLNGRQLADYARQKLPGLRVLFMTGYAEQAAVRSGFLEPGMDIVTKPFAIDALSAKIREMLESR